MSLRTGLIQKQSHLDLREVRHLSNFCSALRNQLTVYSKFDYTPEQTIHSVWNVLQRFINAQDTILHPDSPRIQDILKDQGFYFGDKK